MMPMQDATTMLEVIHVHAKTDIEEPDTGVKISTSAPPLEVTTVMTTQGAQTLPGLMNVIVMTGTAVVDFNAMILTNAQEKTAAIQTQIAQTPLAHIYVNVTLDTWGMVLSAVNFSFLMPDS